MRVTRRIDQGRSRKWKFGGSALGVETVFLLAGAKRRARERPRSATRRSERNKADRHAPTVTDHAHTGDMRDGDPTPQPISKAVNDKGPREMRHAPPLARIRANDRDEWVGPKDERRCVFGPRTTCRRMAEHRLEIAGRDSGQVTGRACPRDRHPHGRRQPGWLRAQHRARSALPKGQIYQRSWKRPTDPSITSHFG